MCLFCKSFAGRLYKSFALEPWLNRSPRAGRPGFSLRHFVFDDLHIFHWPCRGPLAARPRHITRSEERPYRRVMPTLGDLRRWVVKMTRGAGLP